MCTVLKAGLKSEDAGRSESEDAGIGDSFVDKLKEVMSSQSQVHKKLESSKSEVFSSWSHEIGLCPSVEETSTSPPGDTFLRSDDDDDEISLRASLDIRLGS